MSAEQPLIRLALQAAQSEAATPDAFELSQMVIAVQRRAVEKMTPAQAWGALERALMAPHAPGFFQALRSCAGLRRLLPEVDALFGVPMQGDGGVLLDVGAHQMRVLSRCARRGAPLAVRFAALTYRLGMGQTSRVCWPSHPWHEARGQRLLDPLVQRVAIPTDALVLARLAIAECDRIHRVSELRAGALAALLQRIQALAFPERFEQLLEVCVCDWCAFQGHGEHDYAHADRLRRAFAAYASVRGACDEDVLLRARTQAIAQALRPSGLRRG